MSDVNVKQLKVDDVVQAVDLLEAHFQQSPDVVPAGQNTEDHAKSVLHDYLKKQSYGLADHVETLVRNEKIKRAKDNRPAATPATARQLAIDLFTAVTGTAPKGAPAQAATKQAEPAQTKTDSDGPVGHSGTSFYAKEDAAAPAVGKTATETDATVAADETAAPTQTSGDAAKATPKKDSASMTTAATGIASIDIPNNLASSIDTMLQTCTQGRARSIKSLIEMVREVETLVAEQDKAKAWGEAKLKAYKDGDVETAEQAEFNIPSFKPTGMTDVKVEGPMAAVLDTLLTQATGGKVTGFSAITDALAQAEKIASEKAAELRTLSRDIRVAMPKKKISIKAGDDTPEDLAYECEIVMRRASELFVDAFGHSSPILDFEVPTLEFIEKHPDVPEVDPSFRFYAPVLADALDSFLNNEICWLYGESGCGKSEFWAQIAARLNFPLFRLNMDSHLTRADLVGTNRLVPGENGQPIMTFVEGLVPRALRVPSLLLIDEMDLGDPEVMPVLQPVLEGKGIRLLEDAGRYVAPNPWARIAVTANTIGLGSANMMYVNAHEQSAATRDRIARYIEMPYLPADKELEVCMSRVPDANEEFARKVIQLANKVREGYRLNEIHQVFSTRTVLRAIRRHAKFAPLYGDEDQAIHTTLEVTVLNRCDPASRSVVKGIIDNIF